MRQPDARAAFGVAGLAVAILVAAVSWRRLGDFDLPMHLLLGRLLARTHGIPRVDDFSYLHGTIRYVEPISVLLFQAAYRTGGPLLLQIVGGLSAGALVVLLWIPLRRFGPSSLAVAALTVAAAGSFLVVRSSALSFPLLAATLAAIDSHRRRGREGRKGLAAYVALMFVWANTHGSVTFGLLVGAVYAAYVAVCRASRGRVDPWLPASDGRDAIAAIVAWPCAVIGASLNPAGPALLPGPLRFGGNLHALASYSEWARPTPAFLAHREPVMLAMGVLAVVATVVGRDADSRRRCPAAFDASMALLALACAATAVRLLPFAAILLAPWIARRFATLVPSTRPAWLACSGLALFAPARILAAPLPLGVGFDETHFPEGAVRWFASHRPTGHLWNSPPFGAYLAFRLYPEVRVLMDGRNGLAYDLADVFSVDASEQDPAAFAKLVDRHDLQWAVTRAFEGEASGVPLAEASSDWTMVFLDDASAVYVRRTGPNAALAADGYFLLRHLATPEQVLDLASHAGPVAGALAHDGLLAASQAPWSARAAFFDACGALAVRDEAEFRAACERLRTIAPGHPALQALSRAWGDVTASRTPELPTAQP